MKSLPDLPELPETQETCESLMDKNHLNISYIERYETTANGYEEHKQELPELVNPDNRQQNQNSKMSHKISNLKQHGIKL